MKRTFLALAACAALLLIVSVSFLPVSARAVVLYTFGTNLFSGDSSLSTNIPQLTLLFQDVSPGTVHLTISAPGLTNNENVDKLYININPAYNPNSLILANFAVASGSFALPTVDQGEDGFKADGDGKYDERFNFGGSDLTTWFSAGDVMTCDLTGIPTLTSLDFIYLSTPASTSSSGPFDAAVHIVSIFNPNGHGDTSGYIGVLGPDAHIIPVPEPTAAAFASLAFILWLRSRWLNRRPG